MPLTSKGEKIKTNMEREYGPEKGERVFYASANKGTISGVHDGSWSYQGGAWAKDEPAAGGVPPLSTAPNSGLPRAARHERTSYDRSSMGSVSMNGSWRGRSE